RRASKRRRSGNRAGRPQRSPGFFVSPFLLGRVNVSRHSVRTRRICRDNFSTLSWFGASRVRSIRLGRRCGRERPWGMASLLAGLRKLSAVSLGKGGLSLRRPSLRRVVEAALILLLLVQAGRLVWLFAAPTPQAVEARPLSEIDLGVLSRFDAFFRNGGGGAEAAPSDGGGLTLFGVRADGAGGGSAIIGLSDGRQVSAGAGEAVEPGLTLSAVAPDHVMLSRGVAPFRLDFPDMASGAASVAPATAAPPAASTPEPAPAEGAVVDPQRLIAQAGLRPRIQGLGIKGLTVSASGDG